MAKFIDLPIELLECIAEEIGGRHLRRSVDNLLVCRKWFDAAKRTYRKSLDVSTIRIFGCEIDRFRAKHDDFRALMHRKTRDLRLRLLGHWWDEETRKTFDIDDSPYGFYWPGSLNRKPKKFHGQDEIDEALSKWYDSSLFPTLEQLFDDLSCFEALENVKLESAIDFKETMGPQSDFFPCSLAARFIRNLPLVNHISRLTLDLCANAMNNEPDAPHLCDELAPILHRVANVQLRLAMICPAVFEFPSSVDRGDVRLKDFILKLHQPHCQETRSVTARICTRITGSHMTLSHQIMVRAARQYLNDMTVARHSTDINASERSCESLGLTRGSGLDMFRISYVCNFETEPSLMVADCISMEVHSPFHVLYAYADDGYPFWFEDEKEPLQVEPLVLDGDES